MEAPRTPAQWFALTSGIVLLALGVLALVIGSTSFGTAERISAEQFLIWRTNGWDTIAWLAFGGLGLSLAGRVDAARTYALLAGIFFATVAVWGFIDGNDAFSLLAVDTTDNIFHAVLGGLGLMAASAPESAQRRVGVQRESADHGGGHMRSA